MDIMISNIGIHKGRIVFTAIAALFLLMESACGVAPHYEQSTLGTETGLTPTTGITPGSSTPIVMPAPFVPAPVSSYPQPVQQAGGIPLMPSAAQITITGQTGIPPVMVDQMVYINPSESGSSTKVTPSTFVVTVAASDGSPVQVQTLALQPASVGEVQQASATTFEVSVYTPGPVSLVASGSGEAGPFQQTQTVNVPRQINAEWTEDNGDGNECSCDENAIICSNNTSIPVQLGYGGPEGGMAVMTLGPNERGQMSQEFGRVKDESLGIHVGEFTIILDGSIPVGVVTCTAVTMPNSNDTDPGDFKQRFNINDGQL